MLNRNKFLLSIFLFFFIFGCSKKLNFLTDFFDDVMNEKQMEEEKKPTVERTSGFTVISSKSDININGRIVLAVSPPPPIHRYHLRHPITVIAIITDALCHRHRHLHQNRRRHHHLILIVLVFHLFLLLLLLLFLLLLRRIFVVKTMAMLFSTVVE